MKAHLLFADRDPERDADRSAHGDDVIRDLGLDTLINAMAASDAFLRDVSTRCLLAAPISVSEIRYRQAILGDFLAHPEQARTLYDLAVETSEVKRRIRIGLFGDHPSWILSNAVSLLTELTKALALLREFSLANRSLFSSDGLQELLSSIERDIDEDYLDQLEDHLRRLRFPTGVHLTARLGPRGTGTDYVLRRPTSVRNWWFPHWDRWTRRDTYAYRLPARDENGARTLSSLRDQGINLVADAAAQSADHIIDFFAHLRWELGFYIGCLNLHDQLRERRPICMPDPQPARSASLETRGLIDAALAVRSRADVIGNDLDAGGSSAVVITGANQGGKSTFLRALGLAQLMMQAGMFVTAHGYEASIAAGVFTHYRREEDAGLEHGKLDEELARMSALVDLLTPGAILLCNESFACTNEREGSLIAREIVDALTAAGVRIVYVTHMYALAHDLFLRAEGEAVFLRAERLADGRRTFNLLPGDPRPTSYGRDLYQQIFVGAR